MNEKTRPLLSIVVPTKNRYDYLKYFIDNLRLIKSNDFELVIQDNSDDNSKFSEYLESLNVSWLKYFYHPEYLSISQNSDMAILNSSGEYVCYMGDDDAVTLDVVEWIQWMKDNDVDAIRSSSVAYFWPDTTPGRFFSHSGKVIYRRFSGKIKYVNPNDALIELFQNGILDLGCLPLVYHGAIKRTCLDDCYNKCGTFFPAPCPDIANAVVMSLVVKKYAVVDRPIFISGASKHHGGKMAIKNKYLKLQDMFWMSDAEKNSWDVRVPKYGLQECIYANSALSALSKFGYAEMEKYVNFAKNYSFTIATYPELKNEVLGLSNNKRTVLCYMAYFKVIMLCKKVSDLLLELLGGNVTHVKKGTFGSINDLVMYFSKHTIGY